VKGAIASQVGMNSNDAGLVIGKLAPILLDKAKSALTSQDGGGDLLSMIANGGFEKMLEKPAALAGADITATGNSVLAQLTGSPEESRAIAQAVSNDTGVDFSMIKKLLPVLAPIVLGALNKQTPTDVGSAFNDASVDNNGLASMIGNLIDQDHDGSMVDDLLGMAGKFFV
ncbi:MAG: DUF937 domain-containing protein, partial [Epsilonproteobacteria bacterium]|nr:DUF937 domain-containing protein [Campylobacterota bacterium]